MRQVQRRTVRMLSKGQRTSGWAGMLRDITPHRPQLVVLRYQVSTLYMTAKRLGLSIRTSKTKKGDVLVWVLSRRNHG